MEEVTGSIPVSSTIILALPCRDVIALFVASLVEIVYDLGMAFSDKKLDRFGLERVKNTRLDLEKVAEKISDDMKSDWKKLVRDKMEDDADLSWQKMKDAVAQIAPYTTPAGNNYITTQNSSVSGWSYCYVCGSDPCQNAPQCPSGGFVPSTVPSTGIGTTTPTYTYSGTSPYDDIEELIKSRDNLIEMVTTLTKLYQDLLERVQPLEAEIERLKKAESKHFSNGTITVNMQ